MRDRVDSAGREKMRKTARGMEPVRGGETEVSQTAQAFRPDGQADRLRRRAEFLRDLAEAKELRARLDPRRARVVDLRDQRQAVRRIPLHDS